MSEILSPETMKNLADLIDAAPDDAEQHNGADGLSGNGSHGPAGRNGVRPTLSPMIVLPKHIIADLKDITRLSVGEITPARAAAHATWLQGIADQIMTEADNAISGKPVTRPSLSPDVSVS